MLAKVDIRAIWGNHIATLKDERTDQTSYPDLFLFYAVPVVLGALVYLVGVRVSDNAIDVLTNALAILAGLLFNLLVMLQTIKWPDEHPQKRSLLELATQSYHNIAYAIIVSLVALVLLVVSANYTSGSEGRAILGSAVSAAVIHFGLTMCMVLKRMHSMLKVDFDHR